MSSKHQINMTQGNLIPKMLKFALPLILTGTLQLLYNAADIVVVGQFAGTDALSAVGSTGALINLLINLFMGLSIGTSVLMSKYFGAYDYDGMQKTLHCSIAVALVAGVFVSVLGVVACEPMLILMNTPAEVLDDATLYMRIFFLGMPFNMLYTFGSAALRAVGDTKRPLIFLSISGIINVILNLIFVIVFKMGVAGVALATIIAQAVSMVFVVKCLMKSEGAMNLNIKEIRIYKDKLIMLIKIGLPAGIQGSFFSISNMLIQSSINGFGAVAMAGNAASANLEGFVYTSMNAIYQTNLTFVSANVGAKKYDRVKKCLLYSFLIVTAVGLFVSYTIILFGNVLISLYNNDPTVIAYGTDRLTLICSLYFLCGVMEVLVGQLRGLGYSFVPMIVTLCGVCLVRVIWVYTVFVAFPSLTTLYISYPVTWTITCLAHLTSYFIVMKRIRKKQALNN